MLKGFLTSPQAGAHVVAAIVVAGFVAVCVFLLLHPVQETPLVTTMLGIIGAKFVSVVDYYMGSSASSARKSDQIDHLIGRPAAPPRPGA